MGIPMMNYILLFVTVLTHSTNSERLKKVQNCVCYCPMNELGSVEANLGHPNSMLKENAKNIAILPPNKKLATIYQIKNSTTSTSHSTHRKTKKKIVKKHFSKKQLAMIHRAGEKLTQKYKRQNRFGHRNMGKSI